MTDLILPPSMRKKPTVNERQELLDKARETAARWRGFITWAEEQGATPEELSDLWVAAKTPPPITGQS